jgi:hypothetical protein
MTMAASARKTKASGDERPAADEVGALVAGEVVPLAVLLAEVLEWVVDKVVLPDFEADSVVDEDDEPVVVVDAALDESVAVVDEAALELSVELLAAELESAELVEVAVTVEVPVDDAAADVDAAVDGNAVAPEIKNC